MNAISARQNAIGPSATTMKGRRLPSGVWNVSLHGPITSGSARAKTPSAPRTRAMSVRESVKRPRIGGRYAAVVVIENARPKAPSPSSHTRPRLLTGSRTIAGLRVAGEGCLLNEWSVERLARTLPALDTPVSESHRRSRSRGGPRGGGRRGGGARDDYREQGCRRHHSRNDAHQRGREARRAALREPERLHAVLERQPLRRLPRPDHQASAHDRCVRANVLP